IPDGWVEIPSDVVRQKMAQVPGASNSNFESGFQLEKDKAWFTYPYVLIRSIDYPKGQPPSEDQMRQLAKQAPGANPSPVLDTSTHSFQAILHENVPGIGPLTRQLNHHFGRGKSINIDAYAPAPQFD